MVKQLFDLKGFNLNNGIQHESKEIFGIFVIWSETCIFFFYHLSK